MNALEPGTVMPMHRHHASSETVVILRGKIRWFFYDENGNETERVTLDADGWPRMLRKMSVLFECKDGGYRALEGDEVMDV